MGFEPQQPRSTLESANEFMERMALGIEEAKVVLTKVKDEYAMFYNSRREPAPVYAPVMKVTSLLPSLLIHSQSRLLRLRTSKQTWQIHMYSKDIPIILERVVFIV
jgi:hypothetical protein